MRRGMSSYFAQNSEDKEVNIVEACSELRESYVKFCNNRRSGMAERKIFAGARLKRLRQRLNLSQTQMAAAIGVSPSYLNLIERDQRPLTVQVLLKLSSVYGVDVAELSGRRRTRRLSEALKEVFADPLLTGEIASPTELSEFAEAAPNAARGMTRLFEAYREALERLSDLSQALAKRETRRSGRRASGRERRASPRRRRRLFRGGRALFRGDREEAETIAADAHAPRRSAGGAEGASESAARRRPSHPSRPRDAERAAALRPAYAAALPLRARAAYLSARSWSRARSPSSAIGALLDRLTEEAGMTEPEAARICRNGFARRLAEAILAPAERLRRGGARKRLRPDASVAALRARAFARSRQRLRRARRRRHAWPAAGLHAHARRIRRGDRADRRAPAFRCRAGRRSARACRSSTRRRPGASPRRELHLADGAAFRVLAFAERGRALRRRCRRRGGSR